MEAMAILMEETPTEGIPMATLILLRIPMEIKDTHLRHPHPLLNINLKAIWTVKLLIIQILKAAMAEEEARCTIVHLVPIKIRIHTEIKASTHTDADDLWSVLILWQNSFLLWYYWRIRFELHHEPKSILVLKSMLT